MTHKIGWLNREGTTGETWNPITGCTKISEGCQHCYAERMSKRLAGRFGYPEDEPFKVTLHPDRLEEPRRWRKPRTVFVCSMGDLFHKDVPFDEIAFVFHEMARSPQHTFMILTKRPGEMLAFLKQYRYVTGIEKKPPQKNIWLGVTCENQARADERIPLLLQCPGAVRFVSIEPMLGAVDIFPRFSVEEGPPVCIQCNHELRRYYHSRGMTVQSPCPECGEIAHSHSPALSWIICGAETGPGARPMQLSWAYDVMRQCKAARVPFFFKSAGKNILIPSDLNVHEWPQ